jgi:hypothetical protein
MKNFWLARREKVRNRGIQLQSVSGHSFEMNDEYEATYPQIYGFKTPDKQQVKVDNDFIDLSGVTQHNSRYKEYDKCNKRWKRMEMISNNGFFILKDDALNKETPLCQHRNYIPPDALAPFDFGENLDQEIENRRQALTNHQKNYDKLSGTDMKGLNKWLKEYDKLCEAFEEAYQKKHPLPGKEYTFKAQDGTKFKGKFQEAAPRNINKRTYPYEAIENAINMYKEENGSGNRSEG